MCILPCSPQHLCLVRILGEHHLFPAVLFRNLLNHLLCLLHREGVALKLEEDRVGVWQSDGQFLEFIHRFHHGTVAQLDAFWREGKFSLVPGCRGLRSRIGTPRLIISPDALTARSTLGNPQTATVVGNTGANRTVAMENQRKQGWFARSARVDKEP